MFQDALKEINILKTISHPNIIKLHEIITDSESGKIYLIMEYAQEGSIMQYNDKTCLFKINQSYVVNKNKDLDYSEEEIRSFIKDIGAGLEYCIMYVIIV